MPAAVLELSETNLGSPGTVTDGITNLNFGGNDIPNLVAASNPILLGSQSFAKWIRLHLVTANSHSISNLMAWISSGTLATGETIGSNVNGTSLASSNMVVSAYGNAIAGVGGTVTVPYSADGTGILGAAYSSGSFAFATAIPASSNLSVGGNYAGALTLDNTYSDYLVVGKALTNAVPVGAQAHKIFTLSFNEA